MPLQHGHNVYVDVSDHIRKEQVVNVVDWHKETLINFGMKLIDEIKIETPRMGFGQNAKSRVQHESILVFRHLGRRMQIVPHETLPAQKENKQTYTTA